MDERKKNAVPISGDETDEIAEASNSVEMDFMLRMSHDMLTPMNVIMGMTRIASREQNPAITTECLGEIDEASRYLLKLIKELLNVQ